MNTLSLETAKLILTDFVQFSEIMPCPNCDKETKLIGETKVNGNWFCPFCLTYFPYKDHNFEIAVPFTRLTNELEPMKPQSILMGDPLVDFPMDLNTGFLVPSYSYKIKRKRNVLLAVMEDFTRTGRIKSGTIWQFDLIWNERPIQEYEALIEFADLQGYHLPFQYTDVIRGTGHVCYADSDVSDAEADSFDTVRFSWRITE
jgi:hypothetical protein